MICAPILMSFSRRWGGIDSIELQMATRYTSSLAWEGVSSTRAVHGLIDELTCLAGGATIVCSSSARFWPG